MSGVDRREFLRRATSVGAATGTLFPWVTGRLHAQTAAPPAAQAPGAAAPPVAALPEETAERTASRVRAEVALPRNRVPLSFIIDDSTCLVNMGRFCMPQFATAWPDRDEYRRPWQTWPAEIPDDFVRKFGQWCAERGVKGKYSVVPYPACVGWLDRELPGWSQAQLRASLKLVRELMVPNWDIHPEMITHTRVIELATGRPWAKIEPATMENSYPQEKKSVDELAAYLAYALRILKNCELPSDGITTPGGFGNMVKAELPVAVFQAVSDVYGSEIPHYFKYVRDGEESTEPTVEHLTPGASPGSRPSTLTMNVPASTGDWFGGWDGAERCQAERYVDATGQRGRMVELIQRRQPAVMLCHWPGMYCNGTLEGFTEFQRVVTTLDEHYRDETQWMKLSDMARYWAAKSLTAIEPDATALTLKAPYDCPDFTLRLAGWNSDQPPRIERPGDQPDLRTASLRQVGALRELAAGTYSVDGQSLYLCWNLRAGTTRIPMPA